MFVCDCLSANYTSNSVRNSLQLTFCWRCLPRDVLITNVRPFRVTVVGELKDLFAVLAVSVVQCLSKLTVNNAVYTSKTTVVEIAP